MKDASAVAEAKATAKAEVEVAQAAAAGEDTTETATTWTSSYKAFTLSSSTTAVDWEIDVGDGGDHKI